MGKEDIESMIKKFDDIHELIENDRKKHNEKIDDLIKILRTWNTTALFTRVTINLNEIINLHNEICEELEKLK